MRIRRQQGTKIQMTLMLTPMLDMLTVVLIFLIVNFSPEKAKIKQSASIKLPKAELNLTTVPRIHVEIAIDHIKVNGKNLDGLNPSGSDVSTWAILKAKLDEVSKASPINRDAKEAKDIKAEPILVIADREMPYEFLDRTIAHLAANGYSEVFLLTNKGELK